MSNKINYPRLIIAIIICQLAGIIGSFFTTAAIPTWYANLIKPAFSPPNWLFGPVWILLYLLMAISIYLVWLKLAENKQVKEIFWLFWVHLIFNALWSPIFFGLQNPAWALINIIIIWLLIVVLIWKFWQFSKTASYLLIPYLLWVSLATVLNYYLWILN